MKNFLGYRTVGKGPQLPSSKVADKGSRSASHSSNALPQAHFSDSKSTIKTVKPKKNRNSPRRALLDSLVNQLLTASSSLTIPRGTHPEILHEVAAAGGLDLWLSMQPDYEALKKSKQKKQLVALRRKH